MSKRRSLSESNQESTEINISPMIDMVFILLIFFIVTTVFVEEDGLNLDKPAPGAPQQPDEERVSVTFTVTKANKIFHEGQEVRLGNVRGIVSNALRQDEDAPMSIKVEQEAPMGTVVRIMDEVAVESGRVPSISSAPK